jgi:hypothetical protein
MKPAFIFLSLSSNLEISFKVSISIIYQHHFGSNNFSLIQNWKMRARDPKSKRYGREFPPPKSTRGSGAQVYIFITDLMKWNGSSHATRPQLCSCIYRPQKSCASERFVVDFGGKISKSRVFQPFWVGEENWLFQKMNQNLER